MVNTTLVVIGILCSPGIREDYVELGQAIHAGIAVLEGAISEVTAATVFPEIGTSLILSLMIAAAGIVAVLLLLWPLLTSCGSLLLRIHFFSNASARPPRVLTRSFPLYLPHLP